MKQISSVLISALFLIVSSAQAGQPPAEPNPIEVATTAAEAFFNSTTGNIKFQADKSIHLEDDLVQAYATNAYGPDNKYVVYQDSEEIMVGAKAVGTTYSLIVYSAMINVQRAKLGANPSADDIKKSDAAVDKIFKGLNDSGAYFGFDASRLNGCKAPTPYILVLDERNSLVWGFELSPCSPGR